MPDRFVPLFLTLLTLFGFTACSDSASTASQPYVDSNGVTHVTHKLYTYECPSSTTCTKTANTYIVQIDGLFVEPDLGFVEQCIENKRNGKQTSRYCNSLIAPGTKESFSSSADAIQHILQNGINPAPSSSLTARMKAAKSKLSNY